MPCLAVQTFHLIISPSFQIEGSLLVVQVFDDVTRQKLGASPPSAKLAHRAQLIFGGSFRDPCRCCNYNFKLRDAFDTDAPRLGCRNRSLSLLLAYGQAHVLTASFQP